MTDTLSARKRIPEVAKQILSELGLPEDDTQALTVAAILVQFHQDVEREAPSDEALRTKLAGAKTVLEELAQLGGGRSDGNTIAQRGLKELGGT